MNKEENFAGRTIDGKYVVANAELSNHSGKDERLFFFREGKGAEDYGVAKVVLGNGSGKWYTLVKGLSEEDARVVYNSARQKPDVLEELIASLEFEREAFYIWEPFDKIRKFEDSVPRRNEGPLEKASRILAFSGDTSEIKRARDYLNRFFLDLYSKKGKDGGNLLMGNSNESFEAYVDEVINYLIEGHRTSQYEREESLRNLRNIQSKFNTSMWKSVKDDLEAGLYNQAV